MKGSEITGFVVESGGSGYSSAPIVTVPGVPGSQGKGQLAFGAIFEQNGAIFSIVVDSRKDR